MRRPTTSVWTDAPRLVARQVEGHVVESEVTEMFARGGRKVGIERSFQFVGAHLDAREAVVVAHPELLEPPRPEEALRAFDPAQALLGHLQSCRDARGETRHRWFVCDAQAVALGRLAHLRLRDSVGEQRRAHVEFVDRPEPRSVALARVRGVGAVTDDWNVAFLRRLIHLTEAHRPAVIAALAVVRDERGVGEFGELDYDVADTDLRGDPAGVVEFGLRERLAAGRTGNGVVAEGVVSESSDDTRVDPAGEGDEYPLAVGEAGAGSVEFRVEVGHEPSWSVGGQKRVGDAAPSERREQSRHAPDNDFSCALVPLFDGMELTSIPGVGEKTAAALRNLDDPTRALREGDVAALSRAPGLSAGRAAALARAAIRERHGVGDERFLATDRAKAIHRDALSLLKERTVTDYAARRAETFFPTAAESRIEEVRTFVREATQRDPAPEARAALAGVAPLAPPPETRVRERCLATSDAERYTEATEAVPELPVEVVEDARGLSELARSYATVYALDESFAGLDVDGDVRVRPDALDAPVEVVPERPLAFFAANRDSLLAAAAVHEAAGLDPPCDLDRLRDALAQVDENGAVVGDDELDRLTDAVDDLDAAVSTAESVANDHLRAALRERDVTIEGQDFLSLVEQGARIDTLLGRELADEFDEAVGKARSHLADALGLTDLSDLAERAFGGEPTFPVERDDDAVARLRTELKTTRDRRAERLKRELAAELADLREPAEALVQAALDLDVELAVARFARDFDCTLPDFGGEGFVVEGGRLPLMDVPFEAVDPVDYTVEGVTLLSGVNSGGKTSMLDLVALVHVLGQSGLPVPCETARLERVSAIHYQAKTQGTLDAGAFESTLREFGALTDGAADRLVLVDELESITEPGASARIVAGILEALDEQDATAVFVSHLADQIRAAASFPVAVDGIEAQGLENGELVVERSPAKDHLARSTPELIVEKLAGEDGDELYDRLLEKF